MQEEETMRIRTVDISDEAAEVLGRGLWNGRVFMLPAGHLEKPLYAAVDKALRALGGKWTKGVRGHVFEQDAADSLKAALESGSIVDQKKTLEQFFTPADLAGRMVAALDISRGMRVLEPNGGNGRLIHEALEREARVDTVELDDKLAAELLRMADNQPRGLLAVYHADFMAWESPLGAVYDRALMNPPFSGNQDIAHVRRAFEMLRPGGKLAAIMSPHFTFADDAASKQFRRMISYPDASAKFDVTAMQMGIDMTALVENATVQLLPAGTFKEAGTNVSAVLVLIEKAA
jgi:predicted RNA methylase